MQSRGKHSYSALFFPFNLQIHILFFALQTLYKQKHYNHHSICTTIGTDLTKTKKKKGKITIKYINIISSNDATMSISYLSLYSFSHTIK